jgi:hypothetical protein
VREGDLCSVRSGDDRFGVVKILKLEEGVVHVRVYAKTYEGRPLDVADDELRLGTVHDEEFGLGHLPLDAAAFEKWEPEVIRNTTLEPEELEGYQIWREAEDEGSGGVWGGVEDPEREGLLAKVKRLSLAAECQVPPEFRRPLFRHWAGRVVSACADDIRARAGFARARVLVPRPALASGQGRPRRQRLR